MLDSAQENSMADDVINIIRYIHDGDVLWEEPMMYSRLYSVGDPICERSVWWKVTNVSIENDVQIVTLMPE